MAYIGPLFMEQIHTDHVNKRPFAFIRLLGKESDYKIVFLTDMSKEHDFRIEFLTDFKTCITTPRISKF